MLAAAAIAWQHGSDTLDLLLWIIVLLVQSIPYLAALLMSVISACPGLRAGWICGKNCTGSDSESTDSPR